jgi:rhamnosyltransferase
LKSSDGKYFIGLDHLRALAAFMVFTWHFVHVNNGHHAPPPVFPLSLLTEGHTGVALFMTLSGYLFAKLLDGKDIVYSRFMWNRLLRLAPLLFFVVGIVGLVNYFTQQDMSSYIESIFLGLWKPTFPNGGWSVTVELHFYAMIPFLFCLNKKWKHALPVALVCSTVLRLFLHHTLGQVQELAYWTIVGRFDQFVLGILAFRFRSEIRGRHVEVGLVLFLFACFYCYFDSLGGFYENHGYPSPSPLWIVMPTIEGVAYSVLIAWYDNSFDHPVGKVSRFFAAMGVYSYSIYLMHFFVVFKMGYWINKYVVNLSSIYLTLAFSVLCFLLMAPVGHVCYNLIEAPFLKYRKKYIKVAA